MNEFNFENKPKLGIDWIGLVIGRIGLIEIGIGPIELGKGLMELRIGLRIITPVNPVLLV